MNAVRDAGDCQVDSEYFSCACVLDLFGYADIFGSNCVVCKYSTSPRKFRGGRLGQPSYKI